MLAPCLVACTVTAPMVFKLSYSVQGEETDASPSCSWCVKPAGLSIGMSALWAGETLSSKSWVNTESMACQKQSASDVPVGWVKFQQVPENIKSGAASI